MKLQTLFVLGATGLLLSCGPSEEPAGEREPAPEVPPAGEEGDAGKPDGDGEAAEDEPDTPDDSDFVGMAEEAAGALAEERGLKWRVLERDGEKFPATMDYRTDRVNFTVEQGKVVAVSRG